MATYKDKRGATSVSFWTRPSTLIIGAVLVILVIMGISTNNSLVAHEENMFASEAIYGGALDNVTQKIVGDYAIYERFLSHESEIFGALAAARDNYNEALSSGDPAQQVEAARLFNMTVQAIAEDTPEIQGQQVAIDAMNGLEEAVNEIVTKFDDWQDNVRDYNRARRSFPNSLFAGFMGFEGSYDYYTARNTQLDVDSLINPAGQ